MHGTFISTTYTPVPTTGQLRVTTSNFLQGIPATSELWDQSRIYTLFGSCTSKFDKEFWPIRELSLRVTYSYIYLYSHLRKNEEKLKKIIFPTIIYLFSGFLYCYQNILFKILS